MAQIAAADVTYTLIGTGIANAANPRDNFTFDVAFGNGTLTYTSGGIPLTTAKLGCPATVGAFLMIDTGSSVGYVPKFDKGANTIRLYVGANTTVAGTGTPLVEVATSAVVTATTLRVSVSGF